MKQLSIQEEGIPILAKEVRTFFVTYDKSDSSYKKLDVVSNVRMLWQRA